MAEATQNNAAVELDGLERAAVLMMSIGEAAASQVMRHLSPKELQRLGEAISRLGEGTISRSQMVGVLKAFQEGINEQASFGSDAGSFVRRALINAVGEQRADSIIGFDASGGAGISALKWMSPRSVSDLIAGEHPQIIAMVLSLLDSDMAASVLELLPENMHADVLMRLASIDSVRPSAMRDLDAALEAQVMGEAQAAPVGNSGIRGAANILNYLTAGRDEKALGQIRSVDEALANKIQDSMFIFESLLELDDRSMQVLLRELAPELMLVALKGTDATLVQKFLSNMSKRAAQMLEEDMETQGPVRLSEVEAAQREILNVARRLADEGQVMLGGTDDFV